MMILALGVLLASLTLRIFFLRFLVDVAMGI